METVSCPHCEANRSMDWWQDAMGRDYGDDGFLMEPRELPRCGKAATQHELTYHFPQGFGKYILRAMNPGLGELSPEQVEQFETILGCKLRVIYQHI